MKWAKVCPAAHVSTNNSAWKLVFFYTIIAFRHFPSHLPIGNRTLLQNIEIFIHFQRSQSLKKCNLHILLHPAASPPWYCWDSVVDCGWDGICIVATIAARYYNHLCIRQYSVSTVDSSDGFNNSCKWYFTDLENFIFHTRAAEIPQQPPAVLSESYLPMLL